MTSGPSPHNGVSKDRQPTTADDEKPSPESQPAALAEFDTLRAEIVARITLQHQIVLLQLTASGATISLVLARPTLAAILLFLPPIGYLFAAHYASLDKAIVDSANYIRTNLNKKVIGGLGYEQWLRDTHRDASNAARKPGGQHQRWINPLHLTFPGVSTFGLFSGIAFTAYRHPWSYFQERGLLTTGEIVLVLLGVGAITYGWLTVRQVASNHDDDATEGANTDGQEGQKP